MDSLVAQEDATDVNGLDMTEINLNHRHSFVTQALTGGDNTTSYYASRANAVTRYTSYELGEHKHILNSSDTETRPFNYTIKLWKRIS